MNEEGLVVELFNNIITIRNNVEFEVIGLT